jgi:hypothetical protein
MSDTSIRRVSISDQARAAAWRFVQTGEPQENPHAGTPEAQVWRSAYEVQILALSAGVALEVQA